MIQYLMHDGDDNVGVAVVDIKAGQTIAGRILANNADVQTESRMEIPLGHKIALRDFKEGDTVIKYGEEIGKVVAPIQKGDHVHVHNVKTKRW